MSYKKAAEVLPEELVRIIQDYIDGEYLYIPRRRENRRAWGENTPSKRETARRNQEICRRYREGVPTVQLAEEYFLSPKSIQKIVARMRAEAS